MKVKLTINDQEYEADSELTVLEAANQNGITIPTLCYHKDLSPVGSCRLCMVEVENWRGLQAACTLPASNGMVVNTESPLIYQARKSVLEMLLENYHENGYAYFTTENSDSHLTEFMHWVKVYQAKTPSDAIRSTPLPPTKDPNPFIEIDWNKCILCTRCVRACSEIQGRFVWGVASRGNESRIIAGADTDMLSARCESCGACVAYCPTGALDNKMSFMSDRPDKLVTTTCPYCGVGCQFDLNIKDDHVIRVTSNPNAPVNGMHLCVKGRYGTDFVHHPDRLTRPRVRQYLLEGKERTDGRGEWVEVDWDTALDLTAAKLRQARDEHGADSIGVLTSAKCLNEENYLMNKFARQVIGTNNIDHCARL